MGAGQTGLRARPEVERRRKSRAYNTRVRSGSHRRSSRNHPVMLLRMQALVSLSIPQVRTPRTLWCSLRLSARLRGHIPEGTLFRPPTRLPLFEKEGSSSLLEESPC